MSDDSNSRPAKRARREDTPDPSLSADHARAGPSQDSVPKRDGRYWLEDGNVVLIAGETAFRIYKGLLARQSEVFRDMFSASDPDAGPMFDGCPAVHLSDSAEDLRALLQALMPVERRHIYWEHRAYSFDELAAMVLLGHKYQIEDVQEQALNLLKTFYTDQFDTWEKTLDSRWDPGVLFSIETANPIGAVHLARLLSEPSMLPIAFFGCAVLGSEVLDGWTRQDGSVEYLSPEDTKRAVDGYGELSLDCIPTIDRIFNPPPDPDCMSQDTCQEDLQVLYSFAKLEGKQDLRGMLTSWGDWIREELESLSVCTHCERALCRRDKIQRRRLWTKLPTIFDLSVDGWGAR